VYVRGQAFAVDRQPDMAEGKFGAIGLRVDIHRDRVLCRLRFDIATMEQVEHADEEDEWKYVTKEIA
jgi:ribosomal protein S3